jgi:hypothetical protein
VVGEGTLIYVPDAALLDPSMAPLLPPYVMQTIIESVYGAAESQLPQFFSSKCLNSQRAVTCAMAFMNPHPLDDLALLFGTVYLPSFPERSLCLDYNAACADQLFTFVPTLRLNCSATTGHLELFPSSSQSIISLDLGWGPVDLKTPPNTLPLSRVALETECPNGFLEPKVQLDKMYIITGVFTFQALRCITHA